MERDTKYRRGKLKRKSNKLPANAIAANNISAVPEITLMSEMGVGAGLQHVGVS